MLSGVSLGQSYASALPGLYEPWQAATFPDPQMLVLNTALAVELGIDPDALDAVTLTGQALLPGSAPIAMAYAGHQFGGYSPRLGDGRALLLGELTAPDGRLVDLHLKGSGRTPFARGGDGKAAVGPMLREYIISEAMHALGIPTTRALAVVATGEQIARDTLLPGAVLARVAASHLRVGTFQYAANTGDTEMLDRLARYAIERHHPAAFEAPNPYFSFYESVVQAQAELLAKWMLVGFIHGVMNTDNMTISGETIDYGPCAFMDRFSPATVFSSIDHGGRYAYGNQPVIAQWNLARLAETLLPFFAPEQDDAVTMATDVLRSFTDRYDAHWLAGMRTKLGLPEHADRAIVDELLALMQAQSVDFTQCFRSLSSALRGDPSRARSLFSDPSAFDQWSARWNAVRNSDTRTTVEVAAQMDAVNPVYVPRNQLVEAALDAATNGDLAPFHALVEVLQHPFEERAGLERYAEPGIQDAPYRTFCGT